MRSMDKTQTPVDTLMMQLPVRSSVLPRGSRCLKPIIDRLLKLDRMREVHREFSAGDYGRGLETAALELLDVRYRVSDIDHARIPPKGPLVVVANHPFGAVEGLILGALLRSVRSDVKMMVNHILRHLNLAGLKDSYIYVDPFGGPGASGRNVAPLRQTVQWVRSGGALGVFPAGEVSHLDLRKRAVTDPPWSETVARIVRRTRAQVLPVYFSGTNSLIFQVLGLIHPRVRTLMLLREVFNKRGQTIDVRVGKPIPPEKVAEFAEDPDLIEYLRMRSYILKSTRTAPDRRKVAENFLPRLSRQRVEPIAEPVDPRLIRLEVESLPVECRLVETERFWVLAASADQIPCALLEIGRLREITFRDAHEGTGRAVDLDEFDTTYLHLFLWNHESSEIVGGYRLGLADRILRHRGKRGLYTSTLFDYGSELMDRINPAIELGRSFVRPEYQRSYQPLMLLWKGIGAFLVAHPHYRTLFGPVSINNSYHAVSRQLIVAYSRKKPPTDLSRLVRGKHPIRRRRSKRNELQAACSLLHDIQDLSELVSDIEKDQKGIPILLKHYMRLGGEILAFSVDPNFSDVLDGLILVDLNKTDPKLLDRYMGKEGAVSYRQYARIPGDLACA